MDCPLFGPDPNITAHIGRIAVAQVIARLSNLPTVVLKSEVCLLQI